MQQRRLKEHRRRICVFGGPSIGRWKTPPEVDIYPPATRGALLAAVSAGYDALGFIDGALDDGERVPLHELRTILAEPSVRLIGGASLGAVMATQLESTGMRGIGRVFRLFRRRVLSDPDEVYVLHAPAALHHRPLTFPLVNIRYTLRQMRRADYISSSEEHRLLSYLRDVPWFDRDRQALSAAVYRACCGSHRTRVVQGFDRLYRDVKQEDAWQIVSLISNHTRSMRGSRRLDDGRKGS
jgi:hypothetical protein